MATIFERVRKIIVGQLGVEEEEVVPAASFVDDWGADSLGLIELIIFLEEEFSSPSRKIEIPDENVEKIVTVQDMVDYLQDLGVEDEEMITEFSFKPLWLRLEVAQKRLIDELERLKTDNCLVAETLRSSSWAKEDELANLISELEKRRALEKRLREQLAEIEHALRKKDQGTYGLCDNCGQPIDLGRLDALPQANLCLNCKAHEEGSKRQGSGRKNTAYKENKAYLQYSVGTLLEYYERVWEDAGEELEK